MKAAIRISFSPGLLVTMVELHNPDAIVPEGDLQIMMISIINQLIHKMRSKAAVAYSLNKFGINLALHEAMSLYHFMGILQDQLHQLEDPCSLECYLIREQLEKYIGSSRIHNSLRNRKVNQLSTSVNKQK